MATVPEISVPEISVPEISVAVEYGRHGCYDPWIVDQFATSSRVRENSGANQ